MLQKLFFLILFFVITCEGFMNIDQFMITNQTKNRLSLTCQYNDYNNVYNVTNCEYCVYQSFSNGSVSSINNDCIQITNTYKSISERCQGFSDKTDVGYGICSPLSYETFNISTLCICATDFCNTDIDSCQSSVQSQTQSNSLPSVLPSFLPQLETSISCMDSKISVSESLSVSYHCIMYQNESPYINITKCNDYVINNTVLCLIFFDGDQSESIALTSDDYGFFLVEEIMSIYSEQVSNIEQYYNESSSYFYIFSNATNPTDNSTVIQQVCFCAQDNCNSNLTNCLNANRSLTVTNNGISK
ncbi:unnamed protein product [Adineta steineri]|uniref:Uncharacterized protein n=1 Tax=Adineta steineri TaxID=433720 RepID=A0A815KA22_9BILA|nr:unnamed protein product [Adineta steineri]CAF1390356.1 unnamed protein product [Adineta steineri]CAF1596372.1 unnamed protein product [Adineta steineri]CAF1596417.1 unnamed protein product [Adineta steineri]